MQTKHLERLQQRLAPLRDSLLNHPIYREIDSLSKLHLFMESHVFAVWDFMSLLKALQRHFCNASLPWLPSEDKMAARFVNEIVLAEESDEDGRGGYASHFDLYQRAMRECGANTAVIDRFVEELWQGESVSSALQKLDVPPYARVFVRQTFEIIETGDVCAIASAFTFGREDLLPHLFQRIVAELNIQTNGELDDFQFYLSRHIELDGDEHGPMAMQLITSLCGQEQQSWENAERAAIKSLQARKSLWDGVCGKMQDGRQRVSGRLAV